MKSKFSIERRRYQEKNCPYQEALGYNSEVTKWT